MSLLAAEARRGARNHALMSHVDKGTEKGHLMDVLLGTVVDGWELVAEKGHLDDVDDLAHPSGMVVSSGGLDLVGAAFLLT